MIEKETVKLTSANDKLSVSAERVPDLGCEVNLSHLVVRRYSRGSKDTPQTSAVGAYSRVPLPIDYDANLDASLINRWREG